MGYLIQFIAMSCFGISNCLWTYPQKHLPILLIMAIRAAFTSSLFAIFILIQNHFAFESFQQFLLPLHHLNVSSVLQAITVCFISYFGLFFFNKSIKHGHVSISIPILCIGSFIGILAGIFMYKENITFLKFIILLLFIVGLWCMEKLNSKIWKLKFSKGVLYSLLATLFWSASAFYPLAIQSIGVLWFSLILELTVCTVSLLGYLVQFKSLYKSVEYNFKHALPWIAALAICGFGGVLFSNLGFLFLPLHIIGMMGIIQPVISMIIASLLMKEKLTITQYVGVLSIFIGLWIANYK
jgi:drug/metabolite transporter (DMT)-like permease